MDDQSRSFAANDSSDFRSFAVEAFIGHRVSGWPFARFDISGRALRVRLSFPWFITRSQQATAVRAVLVERRFGALYWIRFDDAAGNLSDVRLHLPFRLQQIVEELRRCGYHVAGDTSRISGGG